MIAPDRAAVGSYPILVGKNGKKCYPKFFSMHYRMDLLSRFPKIDLSSAGLDINCLVVNNDPFTVRTECITMKNSSTTPTVQFNSRCFNPTILVNCLFANVQHFELP